MQLKNLDVQAVRTQSAPRVTTLSHQGLKRVTGGGISPLYHAGRGIYDAYDGRALGLYDAI